MAKDWQELTKMTGGEPIVVERVRLTQKDIVIEGPFDLPPLARLTMEDLTGLFEAVIFPRLYEPSRDLFHKDVPDEFIDKVFAAMALARKHTFQVLTKRPDRMHSYLSRPDVTKRIWWAGRPMSSKRGKDHYAEVPVPRPGCGPSGIGIRGWPLSNVWLGVTAENQAAWDERVLLLCQTPAAKRFVSYEPALGLIDIDPKRWAKPSECFQAPPKLDWLICGGESGPHARPMHPDWVRSIRDQCQARTEFLPAQALPFPESIYPAEPVEVRTGGAIVFVVPVERFEKT